MARTWPADWEERRRGKECPALRGRPNRGAHLERPSGPAYWLEVLRIGRAIERHVRPIKLNFEVLANTVPHLHTHVVPRYGDDPDPGRPLRALADAARPPIAEERFAPRWRRSGSGFADYPTGASTKRNRSNRTCETMTGKRRPRTA
jgi:diadenosine tetraphosphate (Ap4A) HIT family hydrolase